MKGTNIAGLTGLLIILFVAIGDKILPSPLNTISFRLKRSINTTTIRILGKGVNSLPHDSRYDNSRDRIDGFETDSP